LFSLFFYAWGEPILVVLMLSTTFVTYLGGQAIGKYQQYKSPILFITLCILLGSLAYYKYGNFFVDNVNSWFGVNLDRIHFGLPLGISFYVFQAVSYLMDLYRKEVEPQKNYFKLTLYISLFPQLIAGPIVRYSTINDELEDRTSSLDDVVVGIKRFIVGLAKKVVIANQVGYFVDDIFALDYSELSIGLAWLGSLLYILQIYFDFSGYSDMAIGLGRVFGFHFDENFIFPYMSTSVQEFWRRWHISLGSWFRDYLYIPMGGSRVGPLRLYFNLFVLFLLVGFWHGASWNFILWGLYFGVFLTIEQLGLKKLLDRCPSVFGHVYLIGLLGFGVPLFRVEELPKCFEYMSTLLGNGSSKFTVDLYPYGLMWVVIVLGVILSTDLPQKFLIKMEKKSDSPFVFWGISLFYFSLLLICLALILSSTYNPFIYFRF